MNILREATDWARSEVFSSTFFILFAAIYLFASIAFCYLGKTEISKAYITPILVVGCLLLTIGGGLFIGNKMRISKFESAYRSDAKSFIKSELTRSEKTMAEYRTVVFKVVPVIIIICSLIIIFVDQPTWRASSISAISMLVIILLIDGNAKGRLEVYHQKLLTLEKQDPSTKK